MDPVAKTSENEPRPRLDASARVVPVLFALLLVLQVMDLHSTLTKGEHQTELNWLLSALGRRLSFDGAVLWVKGVSIAVVISGLALWRRCRDQHSREFVLCLVVTVAAYAAVVASNYAGR
jgi:uncharacterized membrane protein YciS (DUF1049 family)